MIDKTLILIAMAAIFVFEVWLIDWVNRAKPNTQMRRKYSFLVIQKVMFFPRDLWAGRIEADDIPHLQRYRYRFHIFLSSLAILFVMYLAIIFSINVE